MRQLAQLLRRLRNEPLWVHVFVWLIATVAAISVVFGPHWIAFVCLALVILSRGVKS